MKYLSERQKVVAFMATRLYPHVPIDPNRNAMAAHLAGELLDEVILQNLEGVEGEIPFHDEGNATNHTREECSVERCGLEPSGAGIVHNP